MKYFYTFFFVLLITPFFLQAQVETETVFQVSELGINFVSDDGNGVYTIAGDGDNTNGYLAVRHSDGTMETKNFPPNYNYGVYWHAWVSSACTINGTTFARGIVATNTTDTWSELRRYNANTSNYSVDYTVKNTEVLLISSGDNLFAAITTRSNSDTGSWGLELDAHYLVKINQNDLSLEWTYKLPANWGIVWGSFLQNSTDRYIIQELPNGNIAVKVLYFPPSGWDQAKWELWEFDPADAHNYGTILTGFEPDENGNMVYPYKFHTWKIIDGKIYHEKWESYTDANDTNGHMDIYETTADPFDGGSWAQKPWYITAKTDWGEFDLFETTMPDWTVNQNGRVHGKEKYLSLTLAHEKRERYTVANNTGEYKLDSWFDSGGNYMLLVENYDEGYAKLYKAWGEPSQERIHANQGLNVVDARDDMVFLDNAWQERVGESTIILESSVYQSIKSDVEAGNTISADPSWWTTNYVSNAFPIQVSTRPTDEGKLFFRVYTYSTNAPTLILRVYLEDAATASAEEVQISGLKVYPNPVKDVLNITVDENVDFVEVYDLGGRVVFSQREARSISFGNLPRGMYLVKVQVGDRVSVKKVVK